MQTRTLLSVPTRMPPRRRELPKVPMAVWRIASQTVWQAASQTVWWTASQTVWQTVWQTASQTIWQIVSQAVWQAASQTVCWGVWFLTWIRNWVPRTTTTIHLNLAAHTHSAPAVSNSLWREAGETSYSKYLLGAVLFPYNGLIALKVFQLQPWLRAQSVVSQHNIELYPVCEWWIHS